MLLQIQCPESCPFRDLFDLKQVTPRTQFTVKQLVSEQEFSTLDNKEQSKPEVLSTYVTYSSMFTGRGRNLKIRIVNPVNGLR